MPYVLLRHNGKPAGMKDILFLERDVDNLRRSVKPGESFVLINTTTRRITKIKGARKR